MANTRVLQILIPSSILGCSTFTMEKPTEEGVMTHELFFSVLLATKLIGHIKHLEQKGEGAYAAHKALNKFYDDVVDVADTVIETYQGYKKEIVKYTPIGLTVGWDMTALDYLETLRIMIEEYRYEMIPKEQTHIHNELDNLVTLIDGTIYKLTFLQ